MGERIELHDDDKMIFGKWKGKKLGEVPDHYWHWFLTQEWSGNYPALVAYARLVEDE